MYEMHASYPYRFQPAVISGVEKNCWPFSYWEPPCADLPESPLPHDVYGDATDKRHKNLDQGDSDPAASQTTVYKYDILDTIRPKFLNSGSRW